MKAIYVTEALRAAVSKHYGKPVTAAEVNAEYANLARLGKAGVIGDGRREALRDVFVRQGLDPLKDGE